MQQAISNGSPKTALSVGLKIDSNGLPPATIDAINRRRCCNNKADVAAAANRPHFSRGFDFWGGRTALLL